VRFSITELLPVLPGAMPADARSGRRIRPWAAKQSMKNNLEDVKQNIDEAIVKAIDLCEDIYRTYRTIKQQL
jgi:hypothetical protein